LPFGAALHLGEILWGNIGAADRLDFTAIGPAVNLVSRLEGLCRPLGRSVLISGAVAAETTTPLVPLGEHVLRALPRLHPAGSVNGSSNNVWFPNETPEQAFFGVWALLCAHRGGDDRVS
jgi:hypothetical protein